MAVLGVHDAHDCGASLVGDGRVISAVNEERFTKKKNDVGFPVNSIGYLKQFDDVDAVAVPWIGGSALFARVFPGLEVKRRRLWRKEIGAPSALSVSFRNAVFRIVQDQKPRALWKAAGESIGGNILSRKLKKNGIDSKIIFVEHHIAHAACAYYASGFKEALVITLDGAGDGLCGSVSVGDNGNLKRIGSFSANASLGILYGAATIACDMRYSEDEGKLMSLAAYSYPAEIKELSQFSKYDAKSGGLVGNSGLRYEYAVAEYMKKKLLWKYGREAFAYAVQKHVEEQVMKLLEHYIKETGIRNVAVGGGLFSNIIVNMLINESKEVKNFFVFPHMGDGGLSLGAAYYVDYMKNGAFGKKAIDDVYFGPSYNDNQILEELKHGKHSKDVSYEEVSNMPSYAADMLARDNRIVLWFQGRMEYGPRALGNRSVLAMPNDPKNRDRINFIIKKRPYFQPFASSILEADAKRLLEPYPRSNKFMTVGYRVREEKLDRLVAASHIDGTTRPQVLSDENTAYRDLLSKVKRISGTGALVNTSLNKHGMPIVMDPKDALWTLMNTGAECLAIGSYFVEKKKSRI